MMSLSLAVFILYLLILRLSFRSRSLFNRCFLVATLAKSSFPPFSRLSFPPQSPFPPPVLLPLFYFLSLFLTLSLPSWM